MHVTTETVPVSNKTLWAGRIISGLVALFFLFGAVNGLMKTAQVVQGMAQFGFPEHLARVIGVLELVCGIVYLIPHFDSWRHLVDRLLGRRNRYPCTHERSQIHCPDRFRGARLARYLVTRYETANTDSLAHLARVLDKTSSGIL